MRTSVILAALAATPFAASRACSHGGSDRSSWNRHGHSHGGYRHGGDESSAVNSTPTVASGDNPYTDVPAETIATSVVGTAAEEDVIATTTAEVVPIAATDSAVVVDTTSTSETSAAAAAAETSAAASSGSSSTGSGSVSALNMGTFSGISTFYTGDLSGGTCSFSTYSLPAGMHGVALSSDGWDPMHCGACVEITGPKGNKITAMVVDQCPTCASDHIDLFPDAFAELDDPVIGIIQTSYEFVSCGISSPMKLHNKDSTSPYWFAMQVVNHNVPVEALEVSTDGGNSWKGTTRTYYNFFEQSGGFGTESVDVKIKSTTGEEMVVKDVSVASDSETGCPGNF